MRDHQPISPLHYWRPSPRKQHPARRGPQIRVDETKLKNRVAFAIHEDANDVPTREPASLDTGKHDWEVHGGRLGRDHTLEDVPNHYLRDRLMSFTNRYMPKDQAPEARRRVFSDLNEGEIAAYSKIFRKDEARLADGWNMWSDSEWRERCARHEEQQKRLHKMDSITKIAHETEFLSNMGQAAELEEQPRFMDHIDLDIDMTPRPIGQHRNYDDLPPIWASVFHFGHRNREPSKPSPRERKALPAPFYTEINYECDQVRALVKRFIRADLPRIWDLEKFRLVCGLQRPELNEFLEQSGPEAGAQSSAYGLCWEFMRRRQTLGLHPFFDEKKADKIFPLHLAKRRPAKGGRLKQSTRQQEEKSKREVERARKNHRPTDAELRERRRAEAESKEQAQHKQQEQPKQEEQQKSKGQHQKKKRELPVERPARASKRIKAQKAGG